ncbi:MAG: hypothetical protein LJE91_12355 [Gammaproteobacteria bacterium]|jgi:hypothetical protein|nr:hypothetical protein [Gammaproteobacteria bacterium]
MANQWSQRTRILIAQEAARLILDEGIRDFQLAKRKAAEHSGAGSGRGSLPANEEIEQAILQHRELFFTEQDYLRERELWSAAIDAMRFLQDFSPRLVGPMLNGTAGRHAVISLHAFSDAAEDILLRLIDSRYRYSPVERRLRFRGEYRNYPGFVFSVSGEEVETLIFSPSELHHAPDSVVDGKPMARASLETVTRRFRELCG